MEIQAEKDDDGNQRTGIYIGYIYCLVLKHLNKSVAILKRKLIQ